LRQFIKNKKGFNLTRSSPTSSNDDSDIIVLSSREISCHSCLEVGDIGNLSPKCICESAKCVLKTSGPNSHEVLERTCSEEKWSNELLEDGCIMYKDIYYCFCSSNFCNGKNVTLVRGELDCSANSCPNGSICLDTQQSFKCLCPPWNPSCTYRKRNSGLVGLPTTDTSELSADNNCPPKENIPFPIFSGFFSLFFRFPTIFFSCLRVLVIIRNHVVIK
jgi:hypothetical protein